MLLCNFLAYREKYHTVEEETAEGTKKAKQQFYTIKKKVTETMEEAHKAELLQKACKWLNNDISSLLFLYLLSCSIQCSDVLL